MFAAKSLTKVVTSRFSKRSMGGHGHAAPPAGGFEGYVRGIFPGISSFKNFLY